MMKGRRILDPRKDEISEYVLDKVDYSTEVLVSVIHSLFDRVEELERLVLNSHKLTKIPTEDIAS